MTNTQVLLIASYNDIKNGYNYVLEENREIIAILSMIIGPPDEYYLSLDPESNY